MRKPSRIGLLFCLTLLFCLMAGGLSAQVYQVPEADTSAPTGGMTAAIDPVTGQLRQPTPEEASLLAVKAAPLRELKVTQMANGMVMIELDESFLDYLTVRIGEDGDLHAACTRADQVDTILRLPVRATPLMEEK
jgi:hypothetical protein